MTRIITRHLELLQPSELEDAHRCPSQCQMPQAPNLVVIVEHFRIKAAMPRFKTMSKLSRGEANPDRPTKRILYDRSLVRLPCMGAHLLLHPRMSGRDMSALSM